jgi:hypothetical protein
MATKSIKYNAILKRSKSLNSKLESTSIDSNKLYENTIYLLDNLKNKDTRDPNIQYSLRSYIESMCNKNSASDNYWQPFSLAERFNKANDIFTADKIIDSYNNRILPYTESSVFDNIASCINGYDITENQKNNILESIKMYKTADRIINNHNNISKRFNMDKLYNRYNNLGLKYFIDSCSDMINTYIIPSYQKMNTVLEEAAYILDKNGTKYDKSKLAKYTLEYFLTLNPNISNNEISNYRRTLKESYVLDENDLSDIEYLFEEDNTNTIESKINTYLLSNIKTIGNILDFINNTIRESDKEDFIINFNKILELVWDLYKNDIIENDNDIRLCSDTIISYIDNSIEDNTDKKFTKEDILDIIDNTKEIRNTINIIGNADSSYTNKAYNYNSTFIDPILDKLVELSMLLYNSSNIAAIKYVNNESADIIPIDEFKLFKFHNLVNASFNLDKFLKVKEKKLLNKINNGLAKFRNSAKSLLWEDSRYMSSHIYDYIGLDHKADICVRQYLYEDSELPIIMNFLSNSCSEYNDVLLSQNETSRVYYIINPSVAEIRIKESTIISDICSDDITSNMDNSLDLAIETIYRENNICDIYDKTNITSIESVIDNINNCDSFTLERFITALEALSIIGVDKELVSVLGEKFNSYHFNYAIDNDIINESYVALASQEKKVSELVNNYTIYEEADLDDKVEALNCLGILFEYKYPDSVDDDEDDEDDEEETTKKPEVKKVAVGSSNKKSTTNNTNKSSNNNKAKASKSSSDSSIQSKLTNIKLILSGIKNKGKELSTKVKELSRNFDSAASLFVKGIKDSLVSDKRENIIKGNIIPSFSRCIEISIALAGIAIFFSPTAAVIGAFGAFALSHKLTKTERALLLDEIETELEVIDKELAIADSNNNIKKYRALLQYKKNLQRQYQRIRYNIRVGKDILPGSATGVGNNID